ncbi:MAG: cytochrome c-type biogenesis protein CcmH [Rhodobacteraceae bacterium]|nr:cytochrome c-type biogenesis protein CcmH [Paracoccaceae bacterium]
MTRRNGNWMIRWTLAVLLLGLVASPAIPVEPDEMLEDVELEARAQEISRQLRCLVCRNESIDSSNADLAADLRKLVRERLTAGDSDQQVLDYVVDRFGEYVLLKPGKGGSNLILWLAGPAALVVGGVLAAVIVRRNRRIKPLQSLSEQEMDRLRQLTGE